ncbi:MAG: hypothetical protein HYV04_06650 [Deltaproteobacteria bacterium]|nr:hypothetical protein [Deltaproteobacteria bacterium]
MTTYIMLKPTAGASTLTASLAPGLDTLHGKTVGVLSNQKVNADEVLEALVAAIQQRYKVARTIKRVKQIQSQPAPSDVMNDLVNSCDAVIHGVGD